MARRSRLDAAQLHDRRAPGRVSPPAVHGRDDRRNRPPLGLGISLHPPVEAWQSRELRHVRVRGTRTRSPPAAPGCDSRLVAAAAGRGARLDARAAASGAVAARGPGHLARIGSGGRLAVAGFPRLPGRGALRPQGDDAGLRRRRPDLRARGAGAPARRAAGPGRARGGDRHPAGRCPASPDTRRARGRARRVRVPLRGRGRRGQRDRHAPRCRAQRFPRTSPRPWSSRATEARSPTSDGGSSAKACDGSGSWARSPSSGSAIS